MDTNKATQIQQNCYDAYTALDQLKPIIELMLKNWQAVIPGGAGVPLPASTVISELANYDSLRIKLSAAAAALPLGSTLK